MNGAYIIADLHCVSTVAGSNLTLSWATADEEVSWGRASGEEVKEIVVECEVVSYGVRTRWEAEKTALDFLLLA